MMKFRGKLAAAIMAGTMAVSMMGISAMADETEAAAQATTVAKNQIQVTKTIKTDGKTYAPNASFTFSAAPGNGETLEGQPVKAGVPNGIKSVTLSFAPGELNKDLEQKGNLEVNLDAFKNKTPGIYVYEVSEDAVTYDGLTKSDAKFKVYVYMENGESGLQVGNFVVAQAGETAKKDLKFENDYTEKVKTLTVTKKVDGNQVDHTKKYKFTIHAKGLSNENEKYAVYTVSADGKTETPVNTALAKNVDVTVELAENESVKVYGLANDEITVTEDDYSSEGYKTYVGGTDLTTAPADNTKQERVVDINVNGADVTRHVLNVKAVNAPTGIVLNYAPYMLIAGLAVVFAVMFLRRREQEEI